MAKYVLAYSGGSTPASEQERGAVMAAWGSWLGSLGSAIVDPGNPFGAAKAIANDGSVSDGAATGLSGYSIVSADDLEAATALASGCPVFAAGGRLDLYEAIEISM
jgi:hypothetical protein